MRIEAYEGKTKGNLTDYENHWRIKLNSAKANLQLLRAPTQQQKQQLVEHIRAIQKDAMTKITGVETKNVFASPVSTSTMNPFGASSVFGTAGSSSTGTSLFGGTSTASVFGGASTTTPSIFGGTTTNGSTFGASGTSSLFGSPKSTSFGAPSGTTSVFGAAPKPSAFGSPLSGSSLF